MDIKEVSDIFLKAVDRLLVYRTVQGKPIYIETNGGQYLNFKSGAFRKAVKNVISDQKKVDEYLRLFKNLQ